MRKVNITVSGQLGWSDRIVTHNEDDLLLTKTGEVKPVRRLREGDVLIDFPHPNNRDAVLHWEVTKIEYVRKAQNIVLDKQLQV